MLKKRLLLPLFALMTLATAATFTKADYFYPYKYYSTTGLNCRPYSLAQANAGMAIHDWRIYNLPVMWKGINVTPTALGNYQFWCYRWIAIWHCEISNVRRVPGGHVDFIRICGAGDAQKTPTTVLLKDLYIHDGTGLPIIVQDGLYDKITLQNVHIWNTEIGAQVVANQGSIGDVYVTDCPGLQLLVLGKPGRVKNVYIKNCPNIKVWDNPATPWSKTGVKIIHLD